MTDQDDKVVIEGSTEEPKVKVEPVVEPKPIEEPVVEPKTEESGAGTAPVADDTATPTGTDQQGRQLYSVKCASCGKQTEVPFKPSGGRPVYCRDCYMQKKGE